MKTKNQNCTAVWDKPNVITIMTHVASSHWLQGGDGRGEGGREWGGQLALSAPGGGGTLRAFFRFFRLYFIGWVHARS